MFNGVAGNIERYMSLLDARQKLVASNIANADSAVGPGGNAYKAKQVVFQAVPSQDGSTAKVRVADVVDRIDYIVIEGADLPAPLSVPQVVRICDRNWGVGSDGILLKVPAWTGADFGLRILNPDGSEAEF